MYYLDESKTAKNELSALTISLRHLQPAFSGAEFYIDSAPIRVGFCFFVRGFAGSKFSFTDKSEAIMETLYLTVKNIRKYCFSHIRHKLKVVYERAKSAVFVKTPRFLRL